MKVRTLLGGLALAIAAGCVHATETSSEYAFFHEHVLGTSFELRLSASSNKLAASAEQAALAEIDRLAKILSRHDTTSELMQWQSKSSDTRQFVSPDLARVLERAEQWREQTAGAFDVRAVREADSSGSSAPYTLVNSSENSVVHRHDDQPISLDALAKGYIIDQVCEVLIERFPAIENFSVNIGGDLRKVGDQPLPISITNPFDDSEGVQPIQALLASDSMSIATSGNYRRQYHIVDPRSGIPANQVASATVVAPTALDADALATSLCVLSPVEGTALVDSLEGIECLIVTTDGQQVTSRNWTGKSFGPTFQLASAEESKTDKTGLFVNFTLNRPSGQRYRRPYVAVWLEDEDRFPVKTAVLWIQTESPGPRWHRDLTRWYRNDRTRKLVDDSELIGTISEATRGPGEYSARFDGTDNAGEPLPPGKYTLCLEVAREHGTYQIIRETVELGGKPIEKTELEANVEMSAVSYEYVPSEKSEVAGNETRSTEERLLIASEK